MTESRELKLQAILHSYLQAIDRGEKPDRQRLIAENPDVADELREYFADASKLRRLAGSLKTTTFSGSSGGASLIKVRYIGDYELLDEIARGGMGVVYRARQVSLNRIVALKMILKGDLASEADIKRFRLEAEAAATLDHPNIVPIYEVGTHDGHQYFSMKMIVRGPRQPGQRALAETIAKVARAVHHAHQRGIMHRDLKPSNILIDAEGEPHVADFGLAKRVEGGDDATRSGAIVGTPAYMAPEQARAEKSLTTAVDIWSLGAILYEWLTGVPPFRGADVLTTLMMVASDDPAKPRSLSADIDRDLETIALKCLDKEPNRRYQSAAALADDLERWLDGRPILARATTPMERATKWVRRRPLVAGLLAAVVASLLVGTVVSILFAVEAGNQARNANLAAIAAGKAEANAKLRAESEANARAEAVAAGLQEAIARKKEEAARKLEEAARRLADQEKIAKQREFTRADGLRLAAESDAARSRDPGLSLLLAAEAVQRVPSHITFSALYSSLNECRELRTFVAEGRSANDWHVYDGPTTFARFLPGGKRIVAAAGGSLRAWDTETGQQVSEWKGFNLPIAHVAVNPAGTRAAVLFSPGSAPVRHANGTVYQYTDRPVFVVDLASGKELHRLRGATYANQSVEFSPDGGKITAASWDGSARTWDAATGKLLQKIGMSSMALFSAKNLPDGKHVLTVTSNRAQQSGPYEKPADPDFDPKARPLGPTTNSTQAVSGFGANDHLATLWDAATGKEVVRFEKSPDLPIRIGHVWYPSAVAVSTDGSITAIAAEKEVTLWRTATAEVICDLKGHDGDIYALAFRPDGKQIATAGADRTVRTWDAATGKELQRLTGHSASVNGVRYSPSGKKLLSWSVDNTARVWDTETGKELFAHRGHTSTVVDADFTADETRVVTAGDSTARLWTLEKPPMPDLTLTGHTGKVTAIAYSPKGEFFLTASADQSARLWDSATGKLVREFGDGLPLGEVRSARFSPDGARIVTAAANRSARAGSKTVASAVIVWDVATGKQTLALDELATGAALAEFTPDGSRILAVSDGAFRREVTNTDTKKSKGIFGGLFDFKVTVSSNDSTQAGVQSLWDSKTGKRVVTMSEGADYSVSVKDERQRFAFSPDGRQLLVIARNSHLPTLSQTSDGKPVRTFPIPGDRPIISMVGLSPDGSMALAANGAELMLFATATGKTVAVLKDFPGRVNDFAFARDGKQLAVAAHKSVFVFAMPQRKLVSTLKGHLAEVSTVSFNPDGSRVLTGAADSTAAVWDTKTGTMLSVCKGHDGKLKSVLVRADGAQVATLAEDGTARLWPVDLLPALAARMPRTLTAEERERFEIAAGQPNGKKGTERTPRSDR